MLIHRLIYGFFGKYDPDINLEIFFFLSFFFLSSAVHRTISFSIRLASSRNTSSFNLVTRGNFDLLTAADNILFYFILREKITLEVSCESFAIWALVESLVYKLQQTIF